MAEPMSAKRLEYLRARGGAIYGDELRELCAELDRARSEEERLTRRLESAIPWSTDALAVDDAQLRALRLRWSTGPELYQADADALIATVLEQRREIERMRVELESVLAHCAPPVHATASVAAATIRRERDEARAEVAALRREPGPLVPDAPGWWWWREHVSKRWAPVRIGRDDGDGGLYAEDDGQPELPNHISHGEWGGRCEEPRR